MAHDPQEPHLDRARVDSIRLMPRWGEACFQNAGAIFLKQTPLLMLEIIQFHGEGHADALHRAAHTLKGSSSTIGLRRLSRAADDLLRAINDRQVNRLAHLVNHLDHEAMLGCSALRMELKTHINMVSPQS